SELCIQRFELREDNQCTENARMEARGASSWYTHTITYIKTCKYTFKSDNVER
ncbi:hypothetical protein ACJX0J_005896, partial [Zea mays]